LQGRLNTGLINDIWIHDFLHKKAGRIDRLGI